MDELVIKNHDFDEAKEKIRSFTNGAYTKAFTCSRVILIAIVIYLHV